MEEERIEHHPLSPWFADRLEQTRLAPIDPEPFVTFFASTTEDSFGTWLDRHLSLWLDVAEGHRMAVYRATWLLGQSTHADLAIGGEPRFLDPSGRWVSTYEPGYYQPILVFRLAPCSPDRCESALFRSPDPRVRPLIDSLLQDIARAWPETADSLAPFIPHASGSPEPTPSPPAPPQRTVAAKPAAAGRNRVPTGEDQLHRWRLVWRSIKPWYDAGWTASEIEKGLSTQVTPLACSIVTIRRIIRAGRAGDLDEGPPQSRPDPPDP